MQLLGLHQLVAGRLQHVEVPEDSRQRILRFRVFGFRFRIFRVQGSGSSGSGGTGFSVLGLLEKGCFRGSLKGVYRGFRGVQGLHV